MMAQKPISQPNESVEMLNSEKMAAENNEETSKELYKMMDGCRSTNKASTSVSLINVVNSGEELTVGLDPEDRICEVKGNGPVI